jgi:hypothetical protein
MSNTLLIDDLPPVAPEMFKVPDDRIIFHNDPVVLGVAAYRLWKTQDLTRWTDFKDIAVDSEDHLVAQHLKSYYRERTQHILFDVLRKGTNGVSEFRKKLALIAVDQYKDYVERDRGLFYRLPYFYHEDQALDRVFAKGAATNPKYYSQFVNNTQTLCLTPLERVFRSRRSAESVLFWFLDQEQQGIYQITVLSNNQLLSLFDSMFEQPVLNVTANINPAQIRGRKLVYGKLSNIKLA